MDAIFEVRIGPMTRRERLSYLRSILNAYTEEYIEFKGSEEVIDEIQELAQRCSM